MIEVPLDGFADAGFEGLLGSPAQLVLNAACIDGIAAIMCRPVRHMGDQAPVSPKLP